MIKVEVIEPFTLKNFDELKNIQRRNVEQDGKLFVGDIFECTEEMAEYLTGKNALKKVVVKIVEIVPEVEGKIEYDDEPEKKVVSFKETKKSTKKKNK